MDLVSGRLWLLNGRRNVRVVLGSRKALRLRVFTLPSWKRCFPDPSAHELSRTWWIALPRALIWGLARCLQASVNPRLILLMDGLFFCLLRRKGKWMRLPFAGHSQSEHPRRVSGCCRVLARAGRRVGVGAGVLATVFSLQFLCFFLPRKKESSFLSLLSYPVLEP